MMSTEDGLKWPVCSHTCTWLEFLSCGSQEAPQRSREGCGRSLCCGAPTCLFGVCSVLVVGKSHTRAAEPGTYCCQ